MKPYFEQSGIEIYQGNSIEVLGQLPSEFVHCVVTSPPYWGLRDYGTGDWDGGDPNCEHSCGGQVQDSKAPGAITTGVRPGCDASSCLKCGAKRIDEQIGLEKTPEEYISKMVDVFREVRRVLKPDGTCWINIGDSYCGYHGNSRVVDGISPSDKPGYRENMRETTVGKSGLKNKDLVGIPWMLAFALRGDGWWLRQDIIWSKPNVMPESVTDRCTKAHEYIFLFSKSAKYYYDADAIAEPFKTEVPKRMRDVKEEEYASKGRLTPLGGQPRTGYSERGTRNKRSVWEITTKGYSEAHFATYPTELVKPCILAGCPPGGTVLDPFSGSGTTGLVARDNGCKYIGIELNPEYIEISSKRLAQNVLEFA